MNFNANLDAMLAWAHGIMASRPPDFTIGDDYMKRWWVIPRNDFANVYLHAMTGDDDDRALHDHPWPSTSVILDGGYIEYTPDGQFLRQPGDVVSRAADSLHRVQLLRDILGSPVPSVSLFLTGAVEREWGFACPQGWRHWREFVDDHDSGQVGRGCGDAG